MSDNPTAPILALLQKAMKALGWNSSALANACGMDRKEVKRVLAGKEPLTVDAMLRFGQALKLTPQALADLGLHDQLPEQQDSPEPLGLAEIEDDNDWTPNPMGNQPQQLVRLGFALGTDFVIYANIDQLGKSGVPPHVLSQYKVAIPIRLEAAYHRYNKAQFHPEGLELVLSFDALYTCLFPWGSIQQIVFLPEPPEGPGDPSEEKEEPSTGPTLRLVKG